MSQQQRNLKTYLLGLLISLILPFLVLAGLGLYVYFVNGAPQTGALQTSVSPQITFAGRESVFYINFTGSPEATAPPPAPPIDIVFLVDVSGSMTASLPSMSRAVRQIAADLSVTDPGLIRFALIRFDTKAEDLTGWTSEPEKLYEGLKKLEAMTGQNDTAAAFREIDKVLSNGRPEARKVIIFYTDGELEACGPDCTAMNWEEMEGAAKALRDRRVEIYSVGLPGKDSSSQMTRITGSSTNIFDPVNTDDLTTNFKMAADRLLPTRNDTGHLRHQLDGRIFEAPINGTSWTVDPNGNLNLILGKIPEGNATFAHSVVPISWGLWEVGVAPPTLTSLDETGQLREVAAARRPLMLVVGWLPLLFGLLPALLWTLYYYRPSPVIAVGTETPLPELFRPSPPVPLPLLPAVVSDRTPPVPTLFIGLGGAGWRALRAIQNDLKQSHLDGGEPAYSFLWLGIESAELPEETPFIDWAEHPIEKLNLPPEIYRLEDFLPDPKGVPPFLQWFDAWHYRQNATRESLNLAEGSRGNRMLARLAIFRWLSEKSEPLSTFEEKCEELSKFTSPDETRQIIVLCSPDGGIGSGWFLEVGRLLRRITRRRQQAGPSDFVPEIIGIWNSSPDNRRPDNRQALLLETQTAVLSGAYPQALAYRDEGAAPLAAVDSESPFNWIFSVDGIEKNSVAAQSAGLSTILVERHPRRVLLEQLARSGAEGASPVRTRGLHILSTDLREQVFYTLFLRTIGPDILLDIKPNEAGGFSGALIAPDEAQRKLTDWAARLPPGTPLYLLIAAAANPNQTQSLFDAFKLMPSLSAEWLTQALIFAVNQNLRGQKDKITGFWQREWMPGEAIAVLNLLAAQIENRILPHGRNAGGSPEVLGFLNDIKELSLASANELKDWIDTFCRILQEFGRQYRSLDQIKRNMKKLEGRTYLEPGSEDESIVEITREIFTDWLGTTDVSSAIRERLFFGLETDSDRIRLTLNSYISQPVFADSPQAGIDNLITFFRALSRLAPASHIGGAIAALNKDERQDLAVGLVAAPSTATEILLIAPTGENIKENDQLTDFLGQIPQPANQSRRAEARGHDNSAILRLEIFDRSTDAANYRGVPAFIADSELTAEKIRKCAEQKYLKAVPLLPPELRIALSQKKKFVIFARTYRAGQVIRREDAVGVRQWFDAGRSEFLTFGPNPGLAQAAANFVYNLSEDSALPSEEATGGDFSALNAWLKGEDRQLHDDILTLLAIDVAEECLGKL